MTDTGAHVLMMRELKQTILTLNLAIAQIDLSMNEGAYSVDTLIDSFNTLRERTDWLQREFAQTSTSDHDAIEQLRDQFLAEGPVIADKVQASIIAFQFYDRLSQRLNHVSHSLSILADIISTDDKPVDEDVWTRFQEKMARFAAMREESELFDLIFNQGVPAAHAIDQMKEKMRQRLEESQKNPAAAADDDDIELF